MISKNSRSLLERAASHHQVTNTVSKVLPSRKTLETVLTTLFTMLTLNITMAINTAMVLRRFCGIWHPIWSFWL